jgi:hypothetical protein
MDVAFRAGPWEGLPNLVERHWPEEDSVAYDTERESWMIFLTPEETWRFPQGANIYLDVRPVRTDGQVPETPLVDLGRMNPSFFRNSDQLEDWVKGEPSDLVEVTWKDTHCVVTLHVDTTLTQPGVPADAQAAGIRLTQLEGRADSLEERAETLEGRADSLEERATALEGKAETLEGRADSLEGRAGTLEGRADSLEERATALEGKATTQEGKTEALEERATALEGRATAQEEETTVLKGRADSLEERAGALEGRAETLEGRATALEGRATALEGKAETQEEKTEALEERTTALEGRADSLEEKATTQKEKTEALEQRATALEGRADSLEERATALEERAGTLEGRADSLEERATALEGRADSLEGRATALESKAETQEEKTTALEGRATALEEKTAALEESLSEVSGGTGVQLTTGRWEPTLVSSTEGGSMKVVYEMQEGTYRLMGDLCYVSAYLRGMIWTSDASAYVELPFAALQSDTFDFLTVGLVLEATSETPTAMKVDNEGGTAYASLCYAGTSGLDTCTWDA